MNLVVYTCILHEMEICIHCIYSVVQLKAHNNYLIQNSQAVKKESAALKKAMVKKDVKSKVAAKKWL